MMQALDSETLPAIESLNQQIEAKQNAEDRTMKTRALTVMQKMIRSYLGSYFFKWHDEKESAKFGINVHLKQIILRAYKTRLGTAFATWKKGKQHIEITQQEMVFEEQGNEQAQLQAEAEQLGKQIQRTKIDHDRSGRLSLNRAIKICNKRYLLQGMRRWHENVATQQRKESAVDNQIIYKMRLRILKQAFKAYRDAAKQMTQMIKNETRAAEVITGRLNMRTKRSIFNAFLAYTNTFQRARYGVDVIARKIEIWLQRRGFRKWCGQTQAKSEMMLIEQTNEETGELNNLMQMTKQLEREHQDKVQANKQLQQNLRF